MKMLLSCLKCKFGNDGFESSEEKSVFGNVELRDNGTVEFTCNNNHISEVLLNAEKYEILFHMGAEALIDGYKHEAVACMKGALERFYEYCIKIILYKNSLTNINDIDNEERIQAFKNIEAIFRSINLSERQLGAFLVLYLNEFNEMPENFDNRTFYKTKYTGKNKMVTAQFRNKVIHAGYLPTTDEVEEYGKEVYDYIRTISSVFREEPYKKIACEISMGRQIGVIEPKFKEGSISNLSTIGMRLILEYEEENFIDALSKLKDENKKMKAHYSANCKK